MTKSLYERILAEPRGSRLSSLISRAADFLRSASVSRELGSDNSYQPSKQVSALHEFRKRSGYYKEGAIIGLEETIDSLALAQRDVRLGVIETDRGAVAIWLDEQGTILGLMITKMVSETPNCSF